MAISLFLLVAVLSCLSYATFTPYHVYVTLTGDPTEMQLTFTTTSNPPDAKIDYSPTSDPSKLQTVYASNADTNHFITPYLRSEYITSVTLTGLTPQTEYAYSIYCDKKKPANAKYVFKTLPDANDTVNIVLYGDMGYKGAILISNSTGGLHSWASKYEMDFIVHYGDLAYNLASENGTIGDLFMHNLEPISSRIPYVVTAGNHEFMELRNSEILYRNWFVGQTALGTRSASPDPVMWHSYDIGNYLHMIGINSEAYCEETNKLAAQIAWLEKDLTMVRARDIQPWVIVYGHRQMYDGGYNTFHAQLMRFGAQCTDSSRTNCDVSKVCFSGVNCAYSLEALFTQFKVDIYFCGHMHAYNRMLPISPSLEYESQEMNVHYNPQNPIYILSGAAGLEEIPTLEHTHSHPKARNLKDGNGGASIFFNMANHSFTSLSVYNNSVLQLRQIMLNNEVMDELWVIKDPALPPWNLTTPFNLDPANSTSCDQ
eukprot:Phypoly_transcript_07452.p1 GENE.Phypoly_transcript_07452~~Phypoly_transcript_07452.p1  ORF type:complete len:485 (+),score=61.43 Phypoly_transcript_07452:106-1560(+)